MVSSMITDCDIGWDFYNGHCYFLNDTETTWDNGKVSFLLTKISLLCLFYVNCRNVQVNGK